MNNRITSIDSLRGFIILLMILGHTRGFFSPLTFDPIELGSGSIALYLTRVMTNMCAPIFFFLSGMGIFLLVRSYDNKAKARKDLLTRSLILLVFEWCYFSWLWVWPTEQYTFIFGVIWALAISMLILSALIYLPIKWCALIAAIVLLGHNALDYFINFSFNGTLNSFLLMLLHGEMTRNPGATSVFDFYFGYAVIPWFAVMLFGYVLASYLMVPAMTPQRRQRILTWLGLGLFGLFIVLRTIVGYGDPVSWTWNAQEPLYSILYLFKITKYPPSLHYLLFVIGIGCILLAAFDRYPPRISKYLMVFGQSPLFLYIIHVPVLVGSAWLLHYIVFGEKQTYAEQLAIPLPWIYLIWLALVPLLYFACKWYRPIKVKYKNTLLKYI